MFLIKSWKAYDNKREARLCVDSVIHTFLYNGF